MDDRESPAAESGRERAHSMSRRAISRAGPGPRKSYRRCALVICASLVLLLLCASIIEARALFVFQSSGDSLYDRYARAALRQRMLWLLPHPRINPATLDDRALARWESDFATDPRYWQLRYFCAAYRSFDATRRDAKPDWNTGSKYLEEAQRRGAVDGTTLLILYRAQRPAWLAASDREFDAWERQVKTTPGLSSDAASQGYARINRKYEALECAALDAAVKAGPEQCWTYWTRAGYYLELGETDQALADLKLGNVAKTCTLPVPFPLSAALALETVNPPRGSRVLSGALLENCLAGGDYPTRVFLSWKSHFVGAGLESVLGGDTRLTQALHGMACRLGQSQPATLAVAFASGAYMFILANYILQEQAEDLNPEQHQTLLMVMKAWYWYDTASNWLVSSSEWRYPALFKWLKQRFRENDEVLIVFGAGASRSEAAAKYYMPGISPQAGKISLIRLDVLPVLRYKEEARLIEDQQGLLGPWAVMAAKLGELDYATLSRPSSWPKYSDWY